MVKFHTVLRGNQAAAVVERPLDHGIGYIGALLRLHIDDERQRIAVRSDSLESDVECRDTFRHRFFLGVFPADSETVRLYFIIPWEWGKAYDTRMPLSPYCHFERKQEIFFVRGQAKDVRIAASGKHRASRESEGRCFMQTALRKKTETGNEKDPSAALGMTKRGNASFHSFSTCCGSQPRLAALVSPFQGKGLAWTLPPSSGRRCPEGAEVGWGCRYPTL